MRIQAITSSKGRLTEALAGLAGVVCMLMPTQARAAITPNVPTPTVPTLSAPANGATDWLFNQPSAGTREALIWSSALGASKYEVVASRQPDFRDAVDTSVGVVCPSSCIVRFVTGTTARDTVFAGFWWESGTYYWRVRAIYPTSRGTWSTVRSFVTARKPAIVVSAKNYTRSPASLAAGAGRTWLDDTTDRDGARLRSAMNTYRIAKSKALGTQANPTALANSMLVNLATSAWSTPNKWILLNRIAATEGTNPITDQQTLDRLGILAQCKEFADRMVEAGGGTPRAYPAVNAAGTANPRPGMYVFRRDYNPTQGYYWGHAAIVNAIRVEGDGSRSALLSEANSGSGGWNNPPGEVPWLRTVLHTGSAKPLSTTGQFRAFAN